MKKIKDAKKDMKNQNGRPKSMVGTSSMIAFKKGGIIKRKKK